MDFEFNHFDMGDENLGEMLVANNNGNLRRGNRQRRPVNRALDFMEEAMEDELRNPSKKSTQRRDEFDLQGLPEYDDIEEIWGLPSPPEECVLCMYITHDSPDTHSIGADQEDIKIISKIIYQGLPNIPFKMIAQDLTSKWNRMVKKEEKRIIKHSLNSIAPGLLDKATAYSHLRGHRPNPSSISSKMVMDLSLLWDHIMHKSIMERHKITQKISVSEEQARNLDRIFKMLNAAMKNKPKEMLHHQAGVGVALTAQNAYLAVEGLTLINAVKKRKRDW